MAAESTIRIARRYLDRETRIRVLTALRHELPRYHRPPFHYVGRDLGGSVAFSLVLEGQGTTDDGQRIASGSVHRVDVDTRFSVDPRLTWRECSVKLDQVTLGGLNSLGLLRDISEVRSVRDISAVDQAFEALISGIESGDCEHMVTDKLVHWATILSSEMIDPTDDLIDRACAWLETRLHLRPGLETVATALGTSCTTLRRHFRARLGESIGQWLIRRRITRAQQLLQYKDIDTTAALLGYPDRFAFSRQFKQVCGQPPGRWQAEHFD